ncbi:hypothetical protein V4Y02_24115, partial [Escherichia coli]
LIGQRRSTCKIEAKVSEVIEEIAASKARLSTLCMANKKDTLRASQESARPHPTQAQECKSENSLKRL